MSDEPEIIAETTMSAAAYARLCEEAKAEGITPEELLARMLAEKMFVGLVYGVWPSTIRH